MRYLIVFVEFIEHSKLDVFSDFVITETYAIVEITEPYDRVMIFDRPIPLESQAMADGFIISIPLVIVGKSSSKMCSDKTHSRVRVFEPDSATTFVASHSRKSGLVAFLAL